VNEARAAVTPGTDATATLRAGLLDGLEVLLVSAGGEDAAAVREACTALGARVAACDADGEARASEAAMDQLVQRAVAEQAGVQLLVVDGAGMFAAGRNGGGEDRAAALRECLQGTWNATRAATVAALLPAGRGGRIVLLAPAAAAGEHAGAARAGLENLARTLSIEWARHGLTVVAIGAGEQTPAAELAALVAYVASPAGAYLSGCLLAPR
jgi:citronellol/citronellal dehydrogenase